MRLSSVLVGLLLLLPGVAISAAATLPTPQGPVVLTVTGNIGNTNSADGAQFDMSMLDALAQRTTVSETPWYEGKHSFSGPLISALLDAVDAEGTTLQVKALNDYSADLPLTDATDFPVIFATRLDDKEMSVRDKGPLFVIYPFDEYRELYDEVHFGRSVWQVSALAVH
ncbi:MAG: hypothetical protein KKF33_06835 [Alphaproteobacteria bacterium]|nr:hypothetical protein [Alphaproteobacteria bacterium]